MNEYIHRKNATTLHPRHCFVPFCRVSTHVSAPQYAHLPGRYSFFTHSCYNLAFMPRTTQQSSRYWQFLAVAWLFVLCFFFWLVKYAPRELLERITEPTGIR